MNLRVGEAGAAPPGFAGVDHTPGGGGGGAGPRCPTLMPTRFRGFKRESLVRGILSPALSPLVPRGEREPARSLVVRTRCGRTRDLTPQPARLAVPPYPPGELARSFAIIPGRCFSRYSTSSSVL